MTKLALGIMSGTSLDGIDVVLCEISGSYTNTIIKEIAFNTYQFDEILKEKNTKSNQSRSSDS